MAGEIIPIDQVRVIAKSVTESGMFGIKNENQAFTLMLIAQAENLHPIQAVQKYDIIQGKPALKSTEILARFQKSGGKIKWVETSDKKAVVELSHPNYDGTYKSEYTIEDAKRAGLTSKDNWTKRPKEMLRARAVSAGVRAVYPECLNNMYTSEEVQDMPQDEVLECEVLECEVIDSEQTNDANIDKEKENIYKLKKELARKLTNEYSFRKEDVKQFANFYDLSNNIDLLLQMVNQDITEYVKQFENQGE